MAFTKEAFKSANANTDSGDFPDIPSGTYDLVVKRMEIKDAKPLTDEQITAGGVQSRSQTFTIGFGIHDDADEYAKQWVWYRQNITKKDSMPNEIGMTGVNMMLNKLSAGQFSIDHFESKVNEDGEEEIIHPEKVFNRFLDTEGRFKLEFSKNGAYTEHKFTFKSLTKATYSDSAVPDGVATNSPDDLEENVVAPEDEAKEGDADVGSYVQFTNNKGAEEAGIIEAYVESQDPNVPHMIMVNPLAKTKPVCAVPATKCKLLAPEIIVKLQRQMGIVPDDAVDTVDAVEQNEDPPFDGIDDSEVEVSLEEEVESLPLVKGCTVEASWQQEKYRGKVHAIDEIEGIVTVAYKGKGRKHQKEDVKVIG